MATPVISSEYGPVQGIREANGILAYKGIPYGADTAGERRFLPPSPPAVWHDPLDCSVMGPACPQGMDFLGGRAQGEDCLRVSVWTPDAAGKRPVLVWMHGGAYRLGSDDFAAEGADGAAAAAAEDCVFISLTHRLSVLGFLDLGEAFGPEYSNSGNAGLLDIIAAMNWIKRNVAQFGGDPDNITIAGPSGGGSKVMHSLATPAMKGLFHRAIVFVGHDLWKRNSHAAARKSSAAVLEALKVAPGDIEALRALPVETLVEVAGSVAQAYGSDPDWGAEGWVNYDILSPNIDGSILPEYPMDAIAKGASRDIDLIVAFDQWTHWMPFRTQPELFDSNKFGTLTSEELAAALAPMLGDQTDNVLSRYRDILPGASPSSLLALIVTDRDWWIPALRLAEAKAQGGKPARVLFNSAGANAHSYLFGTCLNTPFSRALVGQMQETYRHFIAIGDPNHAGIPHWPAYEEDRRAVLMADYDTHVEDDPFASGREIWTGLR